LKSQASPHCCNPTMDCIIPSHSIRTFGASISALSKIGKDLYVEFDPVDGLILRTLNDAKSAFCEFAFDASYFDRCSSAPTKEKQKRSALTQERYTCRIPLKAMGAVVRPRKGLVSLRIRNQVSADHLYLAFEFQLQQNGSQLSVIHRIAVSDSESVTAVAPKEGCSQIVALPRLLIRMLEPLRTYEVALIINEQHKLITATSFHHGSGSALALSQADKQMKTETSIGLEELEDYDWVSGREEIDEDMPPNVNNEVALVIGIKEIKSMFQFCSQGGDDGTATTLSFHWAGKPLIVETKGAGFTAQLILATLHHSLLGGLTNRTSTNEAQ